MHEAMWVSEDRALLVLAENNGENVAVYDISDCAHPVLTGQVDLEGSIGHMSTLSPDGMTYWVTQTGSNRMFTYVVDISDPSNPVMLPTAEFPEEGWFHQVMINPPNFPEPGTEGGIWMYGGQRSGDKQEALVIVDVSDYQERSPTPEAPVVSFIALPEGIPEPMVPMIIDGQPYIIATDEAGGASGYGSWADACEAGGASFGSPTLVDVSDHNNPSVAAKLWLEVHHPANCEPLRTTTPPDVPGDTPGTNLPDASGTTNYSIERCVPYPSNLDAKIMACSGQNLGLRVWDIRDPLHVREVAYFKPGAPRTSFLPASGSWALGVDRTVDKIAGWAHWVVEETEDGPEVQLWTVSDGNGFFALRFTDHVKAIYPDLWEEVFGG
jgi:hypothetical protein